MRIQYADNKKVNQIILHNNILYITDDFMFELTMDEWEILRCNFGTSNWGGARYLPFAFTQLCQPLHNSVYVNKKIM